MTRAINKLSSRKIETVKAVGMHSDGGGLYLKVDSGGAKRWVFVFFPQPNKRREMGLGSLQAVGLPEARSLAEQARKDVAAGLDPIAERDRRIAERAAAAAPPVSPRTFGEAADDWIASKLPEWTGDKTEARWRRLLEHHAAKLRPRPVATISLADVLEVLKPIWLTVPDMAPRLRGGIEDILDAEAVKGHRSAPNPARWKGQLSHLLSAPKKLTRGHHPAMPFDEVPAFMADLRTRPSISARLVEWTVLTVVRPAEARETPRAEIDREKRIWIIPPERMKERVEHRVPLTDRMIALYDEICEQVGPSEWLFPGLKDGKPLSERAAVKVLELRGKDEFTVHGFRSSFRDWAGERTNFPREVVEACLAHKIGNQVERAYRRGDFLEKRRKVMEAWGGFVGTATQPARVVPFRGRG